MKCVICEKETVSKTKGYPCCKDHRKEMIEKKRLLDKEYSKGIKPYINLPWRTAVENNFSLSKLLK